MILSDAQCWAQEERLPLQLASLAPKTSAAMAAVCPICFEEGQAVEYATWPGIYGRVAGEIPGGSIPSRADEPQDPTRKPSFSNKKLRPTCTTTAGRMCAAMPTESAGIASIATQRVQQECGVQGVLGGFSRISGSCPRISCTP